MKRKARRDEAVMEGVKGTAMLASGLAESRKWQQSLRRGGLKSSGAMITKPEGTACDPTHTEPVRSGSRKMGCRHCQRQKKKKNFFLSTLICF